MSIKRIAKYDFLTGLYNREYFFDQTRRMFCDHPDTKFIFVRIDIVHFNILNSIWGEDKGNDFLRYLADGIRKLSKYLSIATYGRISADIFCICTPAGETDEDILNSAQKYIDHYSETCYINPAIGIYDIDDLSISLDEIYERASIAAQECKKRHTEGIFHFNEELKHKEETEKQIHAEMKDALVKEQFVPYFQPKYDVEHHCFKGAEALVRWNHPKYGIVSPRAFIPIFEKNGFIEQLDQYMWNAVAAQIRKWLDQGLQPAPISVNVSRISLNDVSIAEKLQQIVKNNNIPSQLLNLEITESAYMDDPEKLIEKIVQLQEDGFTIMMDDFGSGYSSLNTLKDIPFDVLKIDMKFIEGDKTNQRGKMILSSVISMAKELKSVVIVEGVEKQDQVAMMRTMDCDYIQGYYYAKPMPLQDYEEILK